MFYTRTNLVCPSKGIVKIDITLNYSKEGSFNIFKLNYTLYIGYFDGLCNLITFSLG